MFSVVERKLNLKCCKSVFDVESVHSSKAEQCISQFPNLTFNRDFSSLSNRQYMADSNI